MHRYPAFLILTLTALCLALAGCNEPTAPPLDNAPAAANAPVASGTGDTPGTTPGTQASVDANTPGAAGGNAPASGSEAPSGNRPRVQMVTSMGTIELELNPEKAPITTQNFLGYVRKGFFDGTIFHRVIPDFMIQGGGFTPEMKEKETGPSIKNEGQNGLTNDRGTIAMARTGDPNSATAQFFINVVDNPRLNYPEPDGYGYAVFGKVTKGMDVVDKIKDVRTGVAMTPQGEMEKVPTKPVVIKSVKVLDAAS